MDSSIVTLALAKGRVLDEALPLFARAGIAPAEDPETSRKLVIGSNRADLRFVILRTSDVPTYVQYGAADLGIAGKAGRFPASTTTQDRARIRGAAAKS